MNAIPPADLEAFAAALLAERPEAERLVEIAVCAIAAAMTFAGRCMELQCKLDAATDLEKIRGADIIFDVARDHGVTVRDIKSPSRVAHIVIARRDAIVRLKKMSFSHGAIARLLNLDHTSVCYALKRASGMSSRQIKDAWTSKQRTDLWTAEEKAVARAFAAREITIDQALARLPRRTLNGLKKWLFRNRLVGARP
jgi:hypothetical protein